MTISTFSDAIYTVRESHFATAIQWYAETLLFIISFRKCLTTIKCSINSFRIKVISLLSDH